MRNKALTILALMLCVSAFFLPVTAYAATDTTPPTVRAWINGDLLHVEAYDDTGVESAYIGSARVNYRVDGSFDLLLRDYAGSDEYISVYAVDFSGNKSNVVQLKNPYYTALTPSPATPTPTAPAATPKPTTPATPSPAPTQTPEPTPETSETAVPAEQKPFTPDGSGTVVDDVMEQNGKEFLTITTPDDNVFYLIIDRQRDSENVYLLNAVTEDDLLALAKKSGGTSESAVPTPQPTTPAPTPEPTPTPEPEPPIKDSGNTGSIIFIVIAALAAGGAGYYFKIVKPKQDAPADEDDYDEDDTDYEDGPDAVALIGDDEDYEFSDFSGEEMDEDSDPNDEE